MTKVKPPKWKTKDGKVMEISKMDNNHLLNAQRWCRKQVCTFNDMIRCADHPVFGPRGDGAVMAFEAELNTAYERASIAYYMEAFLDKEVKNRGLKPLPLPSALELPEIEEVHQVEHGTIYKLKRKEKKMDKSEDHKHLLVNYEFYIAGVQHHQLHRCIANLKEGDALELVPEPTNKFDRNAVRIEYNSMQGDNIMCGYVPKKFSSEISAEFAIGTPLLCKIIELTPSAKPWEQCKVQITDASKEVELDG